LIIIENGVAKDAQNTVQWPRYQGGFGSHKPCRQIYIPSFQQEKKYSPGVLIYNWAEERHKVRISSMR